uniref:Uncharacterized protein n=1 Tax=Cucumis melo TaxID=3656 RepID=A0A9I9EGS5_CUCME
SFGILNNIANIAADAGEKATRRILIFTATSRAHPRLSSATRLESKKILYYREMRREGGWKEQGAKSESKTDAGEKATRWILILTASSGAHPRLSSAIKMKLVGKVWPTKESDAIAEAFKGRIPATVAHKASN